MQNADVIIPPNHPNPPDRHEVEVAWILARCYKAVVSFLIPVDGYEIKTADIVMLGVILEIKSPTGKSQNTVGSAFRRGSKQARHIVFDARRIQLSLDETLKQVRKEFDLRRQLKRVIFITKSDEIIEITR
jgi:hypothetical protein